MTIPGSASPLLLRKAAAAGGYAIERSVRFNSSDSGYLSRTPASAGNRKTWTWAGWAKRSALGAIQYLFEAGTTDTATGRFIIRFSSDDTLLVTRGQTTDRVTSQVFRDVSAYGHFVVAVDTTQGTASDRIKIYYNGAQITAFSSTANPGSSDDTAVNNNVAHNIGRSQVDNSFYLNAYLADVHLVDGQALDPTNFGEFDDNGIWQPIEYTGSYGTNGFHLPFDDNSTAAALGYDAAGSNDWTVNNISVAAGAGNDSLVDVPTNGTETDTGVGGEVRGNYCTLNPLHVKDSPTFANGNLEISTASATTWRNTQGTIGVSSGKWYWESTMSGGSQYYTLGVAIAAEVKNDYGGSGDAWVYDGRGFKNGPGVSEVSYGATYTSGDVIGVALDLDAGTLVFYKNGVSQGTAFNTGLTGKTLFPQNGIYYNGSTNTQILNFGQRPFAYTAPSGFKALCTANLPAPLVTKPSSVMDVALYTGNNTARSITGLGFSPDFVWIKGRSGSTDHALYDIVRGVQLDLVSNSTAAETTQSTGLTAFNSDGFSIGTLAKLNTNAATYAAWTWDAGSSTVTNTAGSITSSVRANATAGFSIVTFTSPTGTGNFSVGHGLGVTPEMVIVKSRDAVGVWYVYHKSLATDYYLRLNGTNAAATDGVQWGAGMTSTVLGFRAGYSTVGGATTVAYAFAPVVGYSSFGSYTGNGSTDGSFVYTGFRPRWILLKRSDSTGAWSIYDAARDTYNVSSKYLFPNAADAEYTFASLDLLSNGFKLRETAVGYNTSGATYIYAAFSETPFNYARAR